LTSSSKCLFWSMGSPLLVSMPTNSCRVGTAHRAPVVMVLFGERCPSSFESCQLPPAPNRRCHQRRRFMGGGRAALRSTGGSRESTQPGRGGLALEPHTLPRLLGS